MIRMTGIGKRGFTLIELLVVTGMIALITGVVSTSISQAMQRARIQKATAETKIITQAILAYESYNGGELPSDLSSWKEVSAANVGFLLGKGTVDGKEIPVLVQASLSSQGVMRDPWGTPYQVLVSEGNVESPSVDSIRTGYYLPNFYRLSEEERK